MSIFEFLRFLTSIGFIARPEIPDIKYNENGQAYYINRTYQVSENNGTVYRMFVYYNEVQYYEHDESENFLDLHICLFGNFHRNFADLHKYICDTIIKQIVDS